MTVPSESRQSPAKAKDEAGDAIPMNKASPIAFIAITIGVLVVGALAVFAVASRSRGDKEAQAIQAVVDGRASAAPALDPKTQSEHIAMTQRALAAAEAKKQEQAAEEAAKKSAEAEAEAPPAGAGAPAPKPTMNTAAAKKAASDLDSLGDDIASQLE